SAEQAQQGREWKDQVVSLQQQVSDTERERKALHDDFLTKMAQWRKSTKKRNCVIESTWSRCEVNGNAKKHKWFKNAHRWHRQANGSRSWSSLPNKNEFDRRK